MEIYEDEKKALLAERMLINDTVRRLVLLFMIVSPILVFATTDMSVERKFICCIIVIVVLVAFCFVLIREPKIDWNDYHAVEAKCFYKYKRPSGDYYVDCYGCLDTNTGSYYRTDIHVPDTVKFDDTVRLICLVNERPKKHRVTLMNGDKIWISDSHAYYLKVSQKYLQNVSHTL